MQRWSVITVAIVAFMVPVDSRSAGRAPSDREQARAKVGEGAKLLEAKDYAAALLRFQEAFGLFPSAKIQYNLGRALAGLGRNADAYLAFQSFLREVEDASDAHLSHSRQEIDRLRPLVSRLTITCNVPAAQVTVGAKIMGTTPLSRPLVLEPGEHLVTVSKSGFIAESQPYVGLPGQAGEMRIELGLGTAAAAPAPAPEPEAPSDRAPTPWWTGRRVAGSVLLVAGLAVASTGGVLLSRAARDTPPPGFESKRAPPPKALSWSLLGSGAASSLAGGILLLVNDTAQVHFALGPTYGAVVLVKGLP